MALGQTVTAVPTTFSQDSSAVGFSAWSLSGGADPSNTEAYLTSDDSNNIQCLVAAGAGSHTTNLLTLSGFSFGLNAASHAIRGIEMKIRRFDPFGNATVSHCRLKLSDGTTYTSTLETVVLTGAEADNDEGSATAVFSAFQYQGSAAGVFGMIETMSADDLDGMTLEIQCTATGNSFPLLDIVSITVTYDDIVDASTEWNRGIAYLGGATHHLLNNTDTGTPSPWSNIGHQANSSTNTGTATNTPDAEEMSLEPINVGGTSVYFNGSGEYIEYGDGNDLNESLIAGTNAITVLWFQKIEAASNGAHATNPTRRFLFAIGGNLDGVADDYRLCCEENAHNSDVWDMYLDCTENNYISPESDAVVWDTSLVPSTTYFCMLVQASGTNAPTLYVDNTAQSVNSDAFTGTFTGRDGTSAGSEMVIGRCQRADSNNLSWKGWLQEIVIFPSALSDDVRNHIYDFITQPAPTTNTYYYYHPYEK